VTQFGGTSTATAITQDGSGFGTLTDVSFDASGTLQGQFSNGRTIPLAQLAIAGFNNEGGLSRSGNNYFLTSAASGEALIGTAGSGGLGSVQGSALEGANVDISIEFSRLIIAQRGFQVNARTITAADETLQELANIIH
jgi:flagellar hook protein FlgE